MSSDEVKKELSILFLTPHSEGLIDYSKSLKSSGFQVGIFHQALDFFSAYRDSASHIVVLHLLSLDSSLEDFLADVLELNPNAYFVVIGLPSQSRFVKNFFAYGVLAFVEIGDSLVDQLNWSLELVLERVLFKLQVDYMKKEVGAETSLLRPGRKNSADSKMGLEKKNLEVGAHLEEGWANGYGGFASENELEEFLAKLTDSKNKDELLQVFLASIENAKGDSGVVIYFKFLAPIHSFVGTMSLGFQIDQVKGLGFKLTREEIKNFGKVKKEKIIYKELAQLADEHFKTDQIKVLPLSILGELDGLFVFFASPIIVAELALKFKLLELMYERFSLMKKAIENEIKDTVTQFYTLSQFNEKLAEEIERAKRISSPLSLLKLSLDCFAQIENEYGESARDAVIKHLALILKRSSRLTDILCRTALNEFTLILPHSSLEGALIKAERLRLIVARTPLPSLPLPLTVSIGLSEYPQIASLPVQLVKSAQQALLVVMGKGGNKVAVAKAPKDYVPEFKAN